MGPGARVWYMYSVQCISCQLGIQRCICAPQSVLAAAAGLCVAVCEPSCGC